ncbi:UPF0547 protein C16orf87 homolog [Ornithodoros turicata]
MYKRFSATGKRMVTKQCPQCEQQNPVACKSCPCGHDFFASRKAMAMADEATNGRRRTERVRRERQSYLTTLLLEERARVAKRKQRLKEQQRNPHHHPQRGRPPKVSSSQDDSGEERKSNRGRPRKTLIEDIRKKPVGSSHMPMVKVEEMKKEEPPIPEDEEDMFEDMSPEQLEQFAFVLEEINRKLMSQLFQQRFLT